MQCPFVTYKGTYTFHATLLKQINVTSNCRGHCRISRGYIQLLLLRDRCLNRTKFLFDHRKLKNNLTINDVSVVLQFLPVCFCSYTSLVFLTDLRGSLKGDTVVLSLKTRCLRSRRIWVNEIFSYTSLFKRKATPF